LFVATIRIPRLVGKTNAGGLTTWYWQPSATLRAKGWSPRRLGASIGEGVPEDVAAAARSLNVEVDGAAALPPRELRRIQRPLTLDEAIRKWREAGFPSVKKPGSKVADATARQYRSKCRTLEHWGKGVALSSITPERVAKLRDALMQPAADGRWKGEVRHHAAHETLRVGRTLFSWLEQQRLVPKGSNPFADFALAAPDPRDQIWWAPAREAILSVAADVDPSMELAIDLAFSIGQREADLLRLQLSQYVEIPHYKLDAEVFEQLAEATEAFDKRRVVAGIRLRQNKGKVWVEVPVVGETRRRIEAQIARSRAASVTCLLFDDDSKLPWTNPNLDAGQRRFIRRFAELRQWAISIAAERHDHELGRELEQLQFRDFRRTAVVFLGELGIADQLIAAITGHTLDETKKILETYMPRTTGMAARAIALSQAHRAKAEKLEQVNG
jgi:hypothetical protein